jgi:hypothetical protein
LPTVSVKDVDEQPISTRKEARSERGALISQCYEQCLACYAMLLNTSPMQAANLDPQATRAINPFLSIEYKSSFEAILKRSCFNNADPEDTRRLAYTFRAELGRIQGFDCKSKIPMKDRQEVCRKLGTALLKAGMLPKLYWKQNRYIAAEHRNRQRAEQETVNE